MEIVGKRIKELRTYAKMSQTALAEKLNVSQDTVSLWERHISLPTADYIVRICILFDISADYLLGLDN